MTAWDKCVNRKKEKSARTGVGLFSLNLCLLTKKNSGSSDQTVFSFFFIQTPYGMIFFNYLRMSVSIEEEKNQPEQALASFSESFQW